MENCNLFKRSFTNKGLGFTFNNDINKNLYKKSKNNDDLIKEFMVNENVQISYMKNAGSKYALNVLIENNIEEVEDFEKNPTNIKLKPINVAITLHNPKEPANIRSNSFKVPLGHSTNVYIVPKAREIDESGRSLSEEQRGCRLNSENMALDIFKVYTQDACILECKIRQSFQRCGCFPWNYLVTKVFYFDKWITLVTYFDHILIIL